MWFTSHVVLSIVDNILLSPFMCFSLKGNKNLYLHMHIVSIVVKDILQVYKFNSDTKNTPFGAGCGHRNCVDFCILITWM